MFRWVRIDRRDLGFALDKTTICESIHGGGFGSNSCNEAEIFSGTVEGLSDVSGVYVRPLSRQRKQRKMSLPLCRMGPEWDAGEEGTREKVGAMLELRK